MSKKRNNKKKINNHKKVLSEYKVQTPNDELKKIHEDIITDELIKGKELNKHIETNKVNINDTIQSTISIMFTIVIFILLMLLIFILYDKFLKNKNDNSCNKEQICQEYIKKDYKINEDDVKNYIINNRNIIYNINSFNLNKISNSDILEFSKYIVWNSESEYSYCLEDDVCLSTKKEMDYQELIKKLKYYFNIDNLNFEFDNNYTSEDIIRLYLKDDKVILTFKQMEFETFKHDIVDIRIDSNNIYIIFALAKRIDNSNFSYVGSKKVKLVYQDSKFFIDTISTNIM